MHFSFVNNINKQISVNTRQRFGKTSGEEHINPTGQVKHSLEASGEYLKKKFSTKLLKKT